MRFPIIDVYNHPHYGDSVRYENYVDLQEVAENLEARHNALREAVAWERKAHSAYNDACVEDGYGQLVWATENLTKARAEVDRLIASETSANCKGEG